MQLEGEVEMDAKGHQLKSAARNRSAAQCCAALLASSLLLMPQLAVASTSVSTSSYVGTSLYGVLTDVHNANGGPGQSSQASSYISNGGPVYSSVAPFPSVGTQSGQATANASAAEGMLRVFASAAAGAPGMVQNSVQSQATSRASWSDGLTITASPPLYGQAGFITANLFVSGSLGGNIGPNGRRDQSSVDVTARIIGTGMPPGDFSSLPPILSGACGGWAYCDRQYSGFLGPTAGYGTVSYDGIPSLIEVLIPIFFGREGTLTYTLDAVVDPRAATFMEGLGTSADGLVDYSSTLLWGGITGVFDAFGNPIFDFTVTSVSGFDYLMRPNPGVPEPGTLLLLGSLLPLVAWRRRRIK